MQKTLKNLTRIWKILKPFHIWLILLSFTLMGTQLVATGFTITNAKLLTLLGQRDFSHLLGILAITASLYAAEYLIGFLEDVILTHKTERNIQQHLQEYSLKRILRLTIEQHIEDHSTIKMTVISNGEAAIENTINILLFNVLLSFAMFVFSVGTLFYYDPRLGIFGFIVTVIIFLWVYHFTGFHQPYVEENQATWRENTKIRSEVFSHLPLVKYQAQEEYFTHKYISQRQKKVIRTIQIWNMAFKHRAKRGAFIQVSGFLSVVYAIVLYTQGSLPLGAIYLVWNVNSRLYWQLTNLSGALRKLPIYFDDLEKYFAVIDKEPSFNEIGKKDIGKGDIVFSNVSFQYPKGEKDLCDSLSFSIQSGKKTAFVGSSGSGKSTITKILLRAYDYRNGSITINGHELRTLDTYALRHTIGYVEQHVDLLDDTIRENILFGVSEKDRKEAERNLEEVSHMARIDQFYDRLGEKKFDTTVGERGIKLSGGERQRIGIARAIIKDPEILIFDEATSALDTENEKYVMDAIKDVSIGKTTIIIAHRLSTVRDADKIIVMDKGTIVGEGTHDELMESSPHYQNLVAHQMSN